MAPADVRLVVFDWRRGNVEGEEAQKLLGYFPSSSSISEEIRTIGLLQGLVQFMGNVTKQDDASSRESGKHIVENDKSIWAIFEAENCIYIAILAQKTWIPRHVTQDNLLAMTLHAHNLIRLAFGPIQSLLDRDPTGAHARACVSSVLRCMVLDLLDSTSWTQKELRNPFTSLGRTPILQIPMQLHLEVMSFCNQVELASDAGGRSLYEDVLLMYDGGVLWSTLLPIETSRMCSLLSSGMMSPTSPKESSLSGASAMATKNLKLLPNGFVVLNKEFCLSEDSHALPMVYDEGGRLKHVLKYQSGNVVVFLFLGPIHSQLRDRDLDIMKKNLEDSVSRLQLIIEKVMQNLGHEFNHLPGYRYVCTSEETHAVKSSPRGKVSSMSHHGRSVATAVIDSLSRTEGDIDNLLVQSQNGTWIISNNGSETRNAAVIVREKRLGGKISEIIALLDTTLERVAQP